MGQQLILHMDYTVPSIFFRQLTFDVQLVYTCVDEVMNVYPDAVRLSADITRCTVVFVPLRSTTEFFKESLATIWFRQDTDTCHVCT